MEKVRDVRQKVHNSLVDRLFNHPELLKINNVITKGKEIELYNDGQLYVAPDLYFANNDFRFFIEVKGSASGLCYRKGLEQMERTREWMSLNPDFYKDSYIGLVFPQKTITDYESVKNGSLDNHLNFILI